MKVNLTLKIAHFRLMPLCFGAGSLASVPLASTTNGRIARTQTLLEKWILWECSAHSIEFKQDLFGNISPCTALKLLKNISLWKMWKLASCFGKIWKMINARCGRHRFLRFQGTESGVGHPKLPPSFRGLNFDDFRPPDRHHHHPGESRGIFKNLKCR